MSRLHIHVFYGSICSGYLHCGIGTVLGVKFEVEDCGLVGRYYDVIAMWVGYKIEIEAEYVGVDVDNFFLKEGFLYVVV